jgi:hypothetical protein
MAFPVARPPQILHANALTTEWDSLIAPQDVDYILGNPPFGGSRTMPAEQKAEVRTVADGIREAGFLDYVTCWYLKAARHIQGTEIKVGFVSTNSISQGEQAGILWDELFTNYHIKIHFAHRTFQWRNEARGNAAVHCVIIGFANVDADSKFIYEYEDIKGEPHKIEAANITPYLFDGPSLVVRNRQEPLCEIPPISFGSMPRDGGNLILNADERNELLREYPAAADFVRLYLGSREFIRNEKRWCLWLSGASPSELRSIPPILARIEATRDFRLASKAESTRRFGETPSLFCQVTQPESDYILVPSVSSERRQFVPMGFMSKDVIISNLCFGIPDATLYHFGVLSSSMHMAWVRTVCGRLESRYRYSKDIVYNNYPWPENVSDAAREKVEQGAQGVLDARDRFPDSSLADLYDPLTMPPELVSAHRALDAAVDSAYSRRKFTTEAERLSFLFELYEKYTAPLTANPRKARKPRKKS